MAEASPGVLPGGGEPAVLDTPQQFTGATSYQVRDELQALIERDLLGPWDGEDEVLPPRSQGPGERYLVGRLGPRQSTDSGKQAAADTATADTDIAAGGDGADPDLPDLLTMQNAGRMWASSMGLSCVVDSDTDILTVTVTWGQYAKSEVLDDDGNPHRQWSRQQVRREIHPRLTEPDRRYPLTSPDVYLAVAVRAHAGRRRVVEISLVNAQDEPPANKDAAWLFQPKLAVTAIGSDHAAFCPIDDPLEDTAALESDPEDRQLRLLYRNQLRHAVGRNVAVHADVRDGERCARRLETTWLPAYEVSATIAPPAGEGTLLVGLELSMAELSEASAGDLASKLGPLADGYVRWLDEQAARVPGLPAALRDTAQAAIFTARQCAGRIQAGITLLADPAAAGHEQALRAFRFANKAMLLQRQHTTIGALREATPGLTYQEAHAAVLDQGAKVASWRPFQLAFVLLNLPALTEPGHADRQVVDLLFFPTGGGKTEAYLGLAAYTFAIRRLQKTAGTGEAARRGDGGVAVLMRYTLRLLTAQQFQRAAALVCAAEVMRREDEVTWGSERFRIGLWVGGAVSPNWYEEAADQITAVRDSPGSKRTGVLQTLVCPWCGAKLAAHRDLKPKDDRRRILLYCPSGEGPDPCPFSETAAEGEGLPILTVDEEIYRLLPSLVVATVDKLAQLPWHGYAGMLFGRVGQWCPRHGYRHEDMDARTGCRNTHQKTPGLDAVASQHVTRLRPPDLIIQDELHLISGALGTTVGLFEAAVDELCSWPYNDGRAGPKIVASTATTKRATAQARGLFGRDLAVFPPPVLDITDTFFSRQVPVTPASPGRRYLGVCAHGVRLKSAEIRLAEILLIAGQTLFDTYGEAADPYMTVVGYFNATRELAGMRRYLDDDVTTRVRRHGRARGMSDRIVSGVGMLAIEELTSRISSADISSVLKRLELGFAADLDTSGRRRAINSEYGAARKDKRKPHELVDRFYQRGDLPVDVVLATSMLQVGVDVSRFGLMVVTGQPKNTAEYIQASSRVGRSADKPGLVITLYNWSRPRDLAHYEDFEHYHATYYRQVEALSVTPYTRRALDRGTAATFVAAVRNAIEPYSRDADAQDVDLDGDLVRQVTARLLARAERASDHRGKEYLAQRIMTLRDAWAQAKTGSTRLGYRRRGGKEPLNGLLVEAGGGAWNQLTVPMSMRETENEVNLLVPGTELFEPGLGHPPWSFTPPAEDRTDEDEVPDADELGDTSDG